MKASGKVKQANYDRSILASDANDECCYCLTNGQVRALLAQTEYLGWSTRWYSPTNAEIDTDKIQAMADDLVRRLFMSCGDTAIVERRIDPVTGYVQERRNGGDWQFSPDDPRIGHTSPIPPVTSGMVGTKCDAAVNVVQYLRDVVVQALEAKATSQNLTAFILVVATVIMAIFVSGQWYLIPIILEPLASLYWGWEASRILLAMDTQTYDEFQCIVFCHIQDDGSFTDSDYEAILADIQTKITDTDARRFISEHVKVWKAKGLSLAAAHGIRDGSDCSDCQCEGCNVANWQIRLPETGHFGEIISTNAGLGYIDIQSTGINTDNKYYLYIQTANPITQGCCIDHMEVLAGSVGTLDPYANRAYNAIDDYNLEHVVIFPNAICLNAIQWSNATPFTIRVYFNPCGG